MKTIRLLVIAFLLIVLLSSCSWFQKRDTRTNLTAEKYIALNKSTKDCREWGFNIAPANSTMVYSDNNMGLVFDVPYNPSWGNKEYKLSPYEEISIGKQKYLGFGRAGQVYHRDQERCIYREYTLKYRPGENSTTKALNSLKYLPLKKMGSSELVPSNAKYSIEPHVTSIGQFEVIKFQQSYSPSCPNGSLIVIGRKGSFELSGVCTFEETFKELENIVKTFRFIE